MKKVLVTGGAGFIGRYVCENLLSKGYVPIIFDHHKRENSEYTEGCETFMGDVRDAVQVSEAMAHADGWIHLAACLGTQETIQDPYPAAETNLLGGLNILQAAAKYDVPGVYIAVGNWWMNNPYSITKNMIERFVHMYNKDRGTRVNIVRAVNAYGPRQLAAAPFGPGKVRKITPAFICRALAGMPIEVYGGGDQVSDMVYVEDVAKALVNALEYADKGKVIEKAVEVGPIEHWTVYAIATLVGEYCAKETGVSVEIKSLPMRPGEIAGSKVIADYSTLDLIGMNPDQLVPIEVGMKKTVDYFVQEKGKAWRLPEQK